MNAATATAVTMIAIITAIVEEAVAVAAALSVIFMVSVLIIVGVLNAIGRRSETYGRAYCAAIPGAHFESIERAGHFPHVEQPQAFADKVFAFTEGLMASSG